MKPLSDQSHYEILDVSPDASVHEIQRAYRDVRSLYDESSLASYAFFTAGERAEMLNRIDEAFTSLSDPERRAAYDRSIGIRSRLRNTDTNQAAAALGGPAGDAFPTGAAALREKVRRGSVNGEVRRLVERLEKARVVTGSDLRELRRVVGLGIEEIEADSTLGAGLIPALEEDRIEDLPSWLNLRESLRAYADLLQADPELLVGGYLKHLATLG